MPDNKNVQNNLNKTSNQNKVPFIETLSGKGTPILPVDLQQARDSGGSQRAVDFDPTAPTFMYEATPHADNTGAEERQYLSQGLGETTLNSLKVGGANALVSFGTALANSLDVKSSFDIVTGKERQFESSLFGITTTEMAEWAEEVRRNNPILEANPGSFNLGDMGWWGNQIASAGTGIGMGVESLLETLVIGGLTGGTGAIPTALRSLTKIPGMLKLAKTTKDLGKLTQLADKASKLKNTATTYAILNRLGESKMEAQQTFHQTYKELLETKDENGQPKFTEAQAREIASEGAIRTFQWNMPLMALDILTYRTMVFNPISGTGTGLLEKGFEKFANKVGKNLIGKAAAWTAPKAVGMVSEGLEEGLQFIGSTEGEHYAKVLAGTADNSHFLERFSDNVTSDEFWNSFAGGVIGSPIIGGAMAGVNKVLSGRSQKRFNNQYKEFVSNIGKMDEQISTEIRGLENEGKLAEANVLRRQFGANKALASIHLDALKDSDTAFNNLINFYQDTLDKINAGNYENLADLGFQNIDESQVDQIKNEFQDYIRDANRMQSIYNNISNNYDKKFVPEIARQQFNLDTLLEEKTKITQEISNARNNISQYNSLTSNGKEIFDAINEVSAIDIELERLKKVKAYDTLSQRTKLQDKKAKLLNTIKEVNSREDYEEMDRIEDDDIINSTVVNTEFIGNQAYNLQLDSQIKAQREKLSKWNDPEYIAQRERESIKTTKTKEDLQETKEQLENKGELTEETAEALEEKRKELEANEVAQIPNPLANNYGKTEDVAAQAEATTIKPQASNLANAIGAATIPSAIPEFNEAVEGATVIPDEDNIFLEPDEINSELSPEVKEALRNFTADYVDSLAEDLGREVEFEDFVRDYIKTQGKKLADKQYKGLVEGWKLNGYTEVDYDKVYRQIFRDRKEIGTSLGDVINMITTNEEQSKAVEKTEEILEQKPENIEGFDTENNPTFVNRGNRTNETTPKMAFVSRRSIQSISELEDDIYLSTYEYEAEGLQDGDRVKSLKLLNPDKYRAGTKLTIRVEENPNDVYVPVYDELGRKTSVKFGELGLDPNSVEYAEKVPMLIYDEDGDAVAFVHDTGWYHPSRFSEDTQGDYLVAQENTRALRQQVLANGGESSAIIKEKRETTFEGLKIPKDRPMVTLEEANPESVVVVCNSNLTLKTGPGTKDTFNGVLHNKKELRPGMAYDVRRYGMDADGNPTYIALPVTHTPISQDAVTTIALALDIYLNQHNNTNPTKKAVKENKRQQVLATTGLDLHNPKDFETFIKQFIPTFTSAKNSPEDVYNAATATLSLGRPYVYIDYNGGNVIFGLAGRKMSKNNSAFSLGPNAFLKGTPQATTLDFMNNAYMRFRDSILPLFSQNVSVEGLGNKKPVVTITAEGVQTISPSYQSFVKGTLKTNIKSHNIGTEEAPMWVTNMQPIITYDLVDNPVDKPASKIIEQFQEEKEESQENLQAKIEEVKEVVSQNESKSEEEKVEISQEELQSIISEAEKDLSWLGNLDNLDNLEDLALEPMEIADETAKSLAKDINRIAGLTPNQQGVLVHFMYQKVVQLVNFDTREAVAISEIEKTIKEEFASYFNPIKDRYSEKINSLETIYNSDPVKFAPLSRVIRGYRYGLSRIDDVESNFNNFMELTKARLNKFTGITETEVERSNENDNDGTTEDKSVLSVDESTDKETSHDATAMQEDGKTNSSHRIKRFLDGIRDFNKDGTPKVGLLDVPLFLEFDTVYNTVAALLAEVPSNYTAMLKRLEENTEALPWLKDLIEKLEGSSSQIKNEFVSLMNKHALNMEFVMYAYDRETGNYSLKVMNTNANSVINLIQNEWFNNFKMSMTLDETGELNKAKAKHLVDVFDSWTESDFAETRESNVVANILAKVNPGNPVVSNIVDPVFKKEIDSKLESHSRVRVIRGGRTYQIEKEGESYKFSVFNEKKVTAQEISNWLKEVGISMSEDALNEVLTKGVYDSATKKFVPFNQLLNKSANSIGAFGSIAYNLQIFANSEKPILIEEEGNNPLKDSSVKKLAKIESKYNLNIISNSFRDNGKSLYGFTATKYITERFSDLVTDETLREQLGNISYSSESLWLKLLNEDADFREKFKVSHMGLTAFKEAGKKAYGDAGITTLSDADHELTKIGLLQDINQGTIKSTVNGIAMRVGRIFSPTMSDKTTMTIVKTAILDLTNKELLNGTGLSDNLTKTLYEQLIKPELKRILNSYARDAKSNIKAYDKGSKLFYSIDSLNNLSINGVDIHSYLKGSANKDSALALVEGELKEQFYSTIRSLVNQLVEEKVNEVNGVWTKNGYISKDENGNTVVKFFNSRYLNKFQGTTEEKVRMAAMDFVINNLIGNSNSFMLIAGDPAIYYKTEKRDTHTYSTMVRDTFTNVGKRLANQIAPGIKLADSDDPNSNYIQIFINDRESKATNYEYLVRLLGEEGAKDYSKIEAADAQEYTTWQEHLHILEKMGKTPDIATSVTPEEIRQAREIFSQNKDLNSLSEVQKQLIKKVMQPIKPVYTGQVYDPVNDLMRVVYIKSSSFPLIPQLTAGLELDKLRVKMERTGKHVRASYQTANKVGAVENALNLWEADGTIDEAKLNSIDLSPNIEGGHSLVLPRKNFRIQQDVPFKSYKRDMDIITLGTQTTKLLFGDGIMNLDGFVFNGEKYHGKELQNIYNQKFVALINSKKTQLYSQLGIDSETGTPLDVTYTMNKLQDLLRDEAVNRGYPKQDVDSLKLEYKTSSTGEVIDVQFTLPLWSSANSNRFESLLNAIVNNRIVKMKFPGYSYVVGSEEGFKFQKDFTGVNFSKIVFTDKWEGELKAAEVVDGRLKKAQVLLPSKFRNKDGKLIDFTDPKYSERDDKGVLRLKMDMIEEELLSLVSFRIPTSGHVSMSQIEIVGFLPEESGDLLIVPKNFTKQMGLDFDIDKQNTYSLFHTTDENGKISTLRNDYAEEEVLNDFLEYYENVRKEFFKNKNIQKEIKQLEDEIDALEEMGLEPFRESLQRLAKQKGRVNPNVTEEEYKEARAIYNKLNSSEFQQQLLINDIIKIHNSVLSDPSDEVQRRIQKTLSIDYAKAQAAFIDDIINGSVDKGMFSPFSDEYQKNKMALGASGKIGTGAYSLDVVGHSLFQQASANGSPLQLLDTVFDEEGNVSHPPKVFRFGNYSSDGTLGASRTISGLGEYNGDRSISEVLAERQNIAVDNEKEQVMGRVNLNDLTLDVDKIFSLLGFDKGSDGNSIAFLFLSQPILRDYVALMKNAGAITAEFTDDKEGKIVQELLNKYGGASVDTVDEEYEKVSSDIMSNENLLAALKTQAPDNFLQRAVLRRFLEMKDYGVSLRKVQTSLNVDSKGLGKSTFDIINKRNDILSLRSNSSIGNVAALVGDYMPKDDGPRPEGAYDLGDYYVVPKTLSGAFALAGLDTAYTLWSKFFPYDSLGLSTVFNEVIGYMGKEDSSSSKLTELKQEIFREAKRYFNSEMQGLLFSLNPQQERARLFFDKDGNTSLASYISQLRAMKDNKVVQEFINSNRLFNKFELDLNKGNKPSLIKFNNAASENFDEDYMHNAFLELIEKALPLPIAFNGKEYNTRMLAQDLINYSILEGGVQEAIQFIKYVPVSYLKSMGYDRKMRSIDFNSPLTFGYKGDEAPSDFAIQFAQHNPQRMPKISDITMLTNFNDGYKADNLDSLDSFELKDNPNPPKFLSIYNSKLPKGEKKFQLYLFDGVKYNRIPVLGTFGLSEYNKGAANFYDSLVNQKTKKAPIVFQTPVKVGNESTDILDIQSGNADTILDNIIAQDLGYLSNLAAKLKGLSSVKSIGFADLYAKHGVKARGAYNNKTHSIELDSNIFPNLSAEDQARTFLHEFIHSLTVPEIEKWKNVENPPAHILKLRRVFDLAVKHIGQDKIQEMKDKFAKREALTAEEKRVVYGASDITEFVTLIMVQPEFQQEMDKVKLGDGKSLWDKFLEIVQSILKDLGVQFDTNNVTANGIQAVFETINKANKPVNPFANQVTEPLEFREAVENDLSNVPEFVEDTLPQSPIIENNVEITGEKTLDYSGTTTFTHKGESITTDFPLTREQDIALRTLIDFVSGDKKELGQLITLSGYAGTGKTSMIKYLEKFLPSPKYIYAAPTHAATAYLGNNIGRLPFTVSSLFKTSRDASGKEKISPSKKFNDSLSLIRPNILVIDEASMLTTSNLNNLLSIVSDIPNLKIVFMGDKAQLPEVSATQNQVKNVSQVFTKFPLLQLTEVKRTSDKGILSVLTEVRSNPVGVIPMVPDQENLKYFTSERGFKVEAVKSIVENPKDNVYIGYTNKSVQNINKNIREALGLDGKQLREGEYVIGYAGYGGKQVEKGHLANSIKYRVDEVKVLEDSKLGHKLLTINYSSEFLGNIPGLESKSKGKTTYLQLSKNDVIPVEGITEENLASNNELISQQFKSVYQAKANAIRIKYKQGSWQALEATIQELDSFMSSIELGGAYIYNPKTDKMEEFNNSLHGTLKREFPELYIDKGIDFGYAITVHKSQGATFKNVFFDGSTIPSNTPTLMEGGTKVGTEGNSLIYVGMSRASEKLVVFPGDLGRELRTSKNKEDVPKFVEDISDNSEINVYSTDTNGFQNLSNFALRPFTTTIETPSGERVYRFKSVEQAFQFHKAILVNRPDIGAKILSTDNGGILKRIGRRDINMTKEELQEWDKTSKSIMLNMMYESFLQNPKARQLLLSTGKAKLTHKVYGKEQDNGRFSEVLTTVREMFQDDVGEAEINLEPSEIIDVFLSNNILTKINC